MSGRIRYCLLVSLSVLLLGGGTVWAQNEGQADLDQAVDTKIDAKSLEDLNAVVKLCESALEKGLDEGNTKMANSVLADTLFQRGAALTVRTVMMAARRVDPSESRTAALADLERSLELNAKQPRALQLVAQLNLLPGGDRDRAQEAVNQAIDLSETEPKLKVQLLLLRANMQSDPAKKRADIEEAIRFAPEDPAPLRVRAALALMEGKTEAALADLTKAIELDPKNVASYVARAAILAKEKKLDEALASLQEGHEANPESAQLLIEMARLHGAKKDDQAMLDDLNKAVAADPNNLLVLLLRAGVYEKLKEWEKAMADVEQVLKLKPGLAAAKRLRASLLVEMDKLGEAIIELEQLRMANADDLLTLLQLGMLYNADNLHDKAVEVYSTLIEKEPNLWMALRGRGDAYLNSGRQAKAIEDYERALQEQPKDSGILNNLAWVLATSPKEELRDGKRAVKLATTACEVTDNKQAHILSTLGAAYAEIGDFESAKKWVTKGLEVAGEKEKEPLTKELETYNAGKPVRELLRDGEPVDPDSQPEDPEPEPESVIPDV